MASKKCPQCAEKVQAAAKICRFCNYKFPEPPTPDVGSQALGAGCVLVVLIAAFLVIGRACSGPSTSSSSETNTTTSPEPDPFLVKVEAEDNVKANLKDPDSAEFRDEFASEFDKGVLVLCGEVNAKNSFGGYTGFKRFVSGAGSGAPTLIEDESMGLGEKVERGLFPQAYARFCHNPVRHF